MISRATAPRFIVAATLALAGLAFLALPADAAADTAADTAAADARSTATHQPTHRAGRKTKRTSSSGDLDPRLYDPDCIHQCHDKQKGCMVDCARSTDDAENKSCNDDCVKAYVTCGKACPARKD